MNGTEYSQAITLETEFWAKFKFSIADNLTVHLNVSHLSTNVVSYRDSQIGTIDMKSVNSFIDLLESLIASSINSDFKDGWSLYPYVNEFLDLYCINLRKTKLDTEDGYLKLTLNPIFDLSNPAAFAVHVKEALAGDGIRIKHPNLAWLKEIIDFD